MPMPGQRCGKSNMEFECFKAKILALHGRGMAVEINQTVEEWIMSQDPWKHRSSGMRCKTCMWFAIKVPYREDEPQPHANPTLGRCRRRAPTMDGYPVVFVSKDWCGDHKLDENKIDDQ